MRTLTIAALLMVLSLHANAMSGADRNDALNACLIKAETIFGEDARVKLNKFKVSRKGAKLSLKVRQAGMDTERVTCLYNDDTAVLMNREGVALIAKEPTTTGQ